MIQISSHIDTSLIIMTSQSDRSVCSHVLRAHSLDQIHQEFQPSYEPDVSQCQCQESDGPPFKIHFFIKIISCILINIAVHIIICFATARIQLYNHLTGISEQYWIISCRGTIGKFIQLGFFLCKFISVNHVPPKYHKPFFDLVCLMPWHKLLANTWIVGLEGDRVCIWVCCINTR